MRSSEQTYTPTRDSDLALARLLRLASPMLPVGAYSYSQGLEAAIDSRVVRDENTAREWIEDVLALSLRGFEAPLWRRLHTAWLANDVGEVEHWNSVFLAARDTAELRAETRQMGLSMRTLIVDCGEFRADQVAPLQALRECGFPTAFAFACAAWNIPAREGLLAYAWAWLENQVAAAMKTIPLGQTAGQRLLAALSNLLPDLVQHALAAGDDNLSNYAPGLAIASCKHETQYSRLFRS